MTRASRSTKASTDADERRSAVSSGPVHLVVGIGASAGGLDAFKALFSAMPADSGMAFVVVQHLDPTYDSSLVSIMAGYTPIPVHVALDETAVQPNNIYVIAPDTILTIMGGVLHTTSPALPLARRTSVNTFLESLALDQGENAVGVILSGFGSDGALGIGAIKEAGGLTLSQAEFDHHAKHGMPQSAASGGHVDLVLPASAMPDAMLDYRRAREAADTLKGPDGIRQDLPGNLATICAVLHSRLGRDFSQYKTGTLMRRIQRRMHVLHAPDVAAYIGQLRTLPDEADLLFRELLISVTRFFRDKDAFEALETTVIPALMANAASTEPLRVWVAGCATGEEAYSVAILLKEALVRTESRRPVQIFATDMDDRAITAARAGLYLPAAVAELSAARLEQNFVKEEACYRVAKDIREMCLFSTHDLVKDPPFSRLDLVCCRNLLIYFEAALQHRVIATFHYALRPGRTLFLGPSESVAAQSRLFAPLSKRHRLYARRDTAPSVPAFSLSRPAEGSAPVRRAAAPPGLQGGGDDLDKWAARAVARYAPAFLVVNLQHEVLRFSGDTGRYIQPASGVASLNLFNLLHQDLRATVRSALKECTATGKRVLQDAGLAGTDERHQPVTVIVEPLSGTDYAGLSVIAFQDAVGPGRKAAPPGGVPDDSATHDLTQELAGVRDRLRSLTEELEAANEELQSSNEEYLSVNEELQSANEELETSKEELQSLNEELQTINAELNTRNDSLVRTNSDLANLFDSTSIATLFLDNDLRIRRFTPRLLEIFKLRDGDQGRPIGDIVSHLTRDGLGRDVRQVLRSLRPIEREVAVEEGGLSYLMQVRPYRGLNDVVDGAVITFVDISERKRAERTRARLAAIVESSQDAIISHDLNGTVTSWNAGAEQLLGYPAPEAIGQNMTMLLEGALPDDWPQMLVRLREGERIAQFDTSRVAKDGRLVEVSVTVSPVREADGLIVGASAVARDISERRRAEQKAALLLGELDHRVKNILAIVSAVVAQTVKTSTTPQAFAAEIEGRIQAISKAHSLLTNSGLGEVPLRDLVGTELAPYDRGDGNVVVTGHGVALTPKAGLALAMAVHELASNAAKYGALSAQGGRLSVGWRVTDGPALVLAWTETGGPKVLPPTRRGFGTTLIERALAHELDATVVREFLPEGLRCTMTIPLTAEVGRADFIEGGANGR